MKDFLLVFQIVISIFLVLAILLQARGAGLGSSFGGGGEFYRSKRGLEKILFYVSVVLVILFLISSVLNIIIA